VVHAALSLTLSFGSACHPLSPSSPVATCHSRSTGINAPGLLVLVIHPVGSLFTAPAWSETHHIPLVLRCKNTLSLPSGRAPYECEGERERGRERGRENKNGQGKHTSERNIFIFILICDAPLRTKTGFETFVSHM